MKKLILTVAVATMIAGVVFVACQKEVTKTDKKEVIKQGVKQQKMGNFPMEEFPNVLYSHDGVNFFDENGAEITGIRVDFEEANRKAFIGINENGHEYITACYGEGDNCGNAIIWNDETGMSWETHYAIAHDGSIIIGANSHELPEEPINEIFDVLYSYDGIEFFNENGDIVTTIHVKFDEANKKAVISQEGRIAFCGHTGNTCGHATVWDDETTMSWDARYAVCNDGRIIIERYCL